MSDSGPFKKAVILVLVNVSVACGAVVLLEGIGQIGFYLRHGQFLFQKDVEIAEREPLFEAHPYLVGRLRKGMSVEENGTTITTTDSHTRWTGAPDDCSQRSRIAVLGGSTAFATRVTDVESWPAVLQNRLGDEFCVRNYGVPGYSTAEGIIQMALIVPEFQPHIVIVFEGWNDIRNYHQPGLSSDYYQHGMAQPENLGLESAQNKSRAHRIAQRSAIVRMARAARSRLSVDSQVEENRALGFPDPEVDQIYVRNLGTIALLADHFESRTLFVPQILNFDYFAGRSGSVPWSPFIKSESMPELMTRFNGLMKSVCIEHGPRCVFVQDVLDVDWTPEDFVDAGHFSRAGGENFAEILSRVILSEVDAFPEDVN